ncbi:uncharacterized protein LOC122295510 isoform X1 [Carya illinoinensis]|uniref:uncharacterized protein LOC122295510 isoform X1 n=1 Tax=Carya illinoinensis TaxID=32201 RepID=UPI001C72855A|nr:uncharacterized protein LOC122295510 isoform X1 [Carya illinoinensis]
MNPSAPTSPSLLSSLSRAPSRTAAISLQSGHANVAEALSFDRTAHGRVISSSNDSCSALHFTTHHIRKPKETRNSNLLSSTSLPLREFQLRSPPALQFRHLKSVAFRVQTRHEKYFDIRPCEYLEFFSLKRRNKVDYVESVTGSQGVSFPALSHMAINIPFVGYMAPIYLLSSLCMACFWKAFWTYVDHDTFTVVLDLAFGWLV